MHKIVNSSNHDDYRSEEFLDALYDDLSIWEQYALSYLVYRKIVGNRKYELLHDMRSPDPLPNEINERYPNLISKVRANFREVYTDIPVGSDDENKKICDLLDELFGSNLADLKFDLLYASYDRLFDRVANPTGQQMASYAADLLEPLENQTFADFCSGIGQMLDAVIPLKPRSITAIEINPELSFVSHLRSDILCRDNNVDAAKMPADFIAQDVFRYSLEHPEQTFDRIFCHCPWGTVADMSDEDFKKLWRNTLFEDVSLSPKSDWKYLTLSFKHLAKDGKACVVVPPSIEYKESDRDIREAFIKHGLIEQVVKMPRGFIPGSLSASYLIVISQGNRHIEFTDLSDTYVLQNINLMTSLHEASDKRGYPANQSSDLFVGEEVVPYSVKKPVRNKETVKFERKEKRGADQSSSGLIEKKIIKSNTEILEDQRLDPTFHNLPTVENGIELTKVAEIRRGTSLTKKFLDTNLVDMATNIELIRLSNIHDGLIESMHFLDALPEKAVVLKYGDILVTRVTSQIDVLIYVEDSDKVKTLVDENFFVIRCTGYMDPFYLYAYLNSRAGKQQLAGNFRGVTINKLRTQDLKKLNIPLVDQRDTERIALQTRHNLNDIRRQKLELSLAMEEQQNFLDAQFKGAL